MTVIFICLTPFFKVYLGLISWLIGLKELVSLTMIAMETGKHYFSYHRDGCKEDKMLNQKKKTSFTFLYRPQKGTFLENKKFYDYLANPGEKQE